MKSVQPAVVALLTAAFSTSCATTGTLAPIAAGDNNEASLLTRYTLSQCLAAAYPDTDIARDASAAAGGYLEFGSLPIETYQGATALARKAAARTYTSKHGEPLHAMKCLDLLGSAELEGLLDRNIR